jgi:catalase
VSFCFLQERTVKNFSQVDAEFGRKLTEGLRKHAKKSSVASANL